jgi:hypothetical protein
VGLGPRHLPRGQTKSTVLTGQCDDITAPGTYKWNFNRSIYFELGHVSVWKRFSGSRRSYGYQRRWFFGHRNLAGGMSERRRMQVAGAGALLDARKMMDNTKMIRSSPWCRGASQRGRRRSDEGDRRRPVIGMPSSSVPIGGFPARFAWRDAPGKHGGALELPTEAWGCRQRRGWRSLELGFWFPARELGERGRTTAPRAYPHWRYPFYRPRRAAAFIRSVHEAAVNQAPGSSPPSCFLPEEEEGQTGIQTGLRGCGVGPAWLGFGPGKCFSHFFSA